MSSNEILKKIILIHGKCSCAIRSIESFWALLHPLCRRKISIKILLYLYLHHGSIYYTMYYVLRYSIPYTAIQSATSQRRMFHLVYLSLDGEETSLDFKLDSSQSASGLYRAITEKHAFYSCETVRSAVTAQFIRDLKVHPCSGFRFTYWIYF